MITPKKPLSIQRKAALGLINGAEKLGYYAPSFILTGVFMLSMAGFQKMINKQTLADCANSQGVIVTQGTAIGDSYHCVRSLQVKPFHEPLHP